MVKFKSTNPFTEVQLASVQVAGQEVAKTAVTVKDDEGKMQLAGIQGPEYQLITNHQVRDFIDDLTSRSEHTFKPIKTIWDGKRFATMHISEQRIASYSNGHERGLFVGIMRRNSYDGTSTFGLEIFAFDIECANQFHHRNRFGYFAIRHTPEAQNRFDVQDALTNLSKGAQNVIEAAPIIQNLRTQPLNHRLLIEAKQKTDLPTSRWGAVLDRLGQEEDNAFGLFQALTNTTTHQMTGFSGIQSNNSVCQYFLNGHNN
jgi:hypothetical protein